jgi:nicotinate-nucleotide adenylyltransferase
MAKTKRQRRIGILGGTFDPPHIGHLIVAEQACVQYGLDRVVLVPAFIPPHKRKRSSAKAEHRLAMLRRAVRGNSSLSVSDLELKREGVSYTIDTVEELRRRYHHSTLFLLIGEDNSRQFHTWKDHRRILRFARVAVYRRLGAKERTPRIRGLLELEGPLVDVSSSLIRRLVRQRKSIRYLVPSSVERYIGRMKLYRSR